MLTTKRETDPSYSLFDQDAHDKQFRPFVGVIAALFAVYCVWLLVLVADASRALRNLTPPFLFIAAITLVTIVLTLIGPFLGAFFATPDSSAAFAIFFGAQV